MHRGVLLFGLAACFGGGDLDDRVQAHIESTGLSYQDCGRAAEICHSLDGAVACFEAAWGACTPAMVEVTAATVEGDPITSVLFVEPEGAGCGIHQITDSTGDSFGNGEIAESTCASLGGNVDGVCPAIYGEDCISECDGHADCG